MLMSLSVVDHENRCAGNDVSRHGTPGVVHARRLIYLASGYQVFTAECTACQKQDCQESEGSIPHLPPAAQAGAEAPPVSRWLVVMVSEPVSTSQSLQR